MISEPVEKGKIVGAVLDALERLVGIVRPELDPALRAKQRRADRATKVEIEAGGLPPVRRLADEARARDAAAADDAAGLDALDDRAGVGGAESEGERERRRAAGPERADRPSRRPLAALLRTSGCACPPPEPRP